MHAPNQMDAQEFLLSSSSSDHALMAPYNAVVEDHDHHQIMTTMMIPSHNHDHGNDDDHEFMIPTNSSSSSISAPNNNNNNMLFSPLLPMQNPQTPYTLDNIDWVSLLSPPTPAEVAPFKLISLPMVSASSPVPTINSSSNNNNDNNKNNNNGGGGGGGGSHDHQMRGDRSMAEINGGGSSNNSKGNRGGLSSSSSYNSSNYNNSTMKKKGVTPRVAFYTKSNEDVLDDGYKWRKYGQKSVKNTVHPRSYYRCTYHTCNVKKQIQRHSRDKSIVITTYEGIHNHPSEKLMETLGPLLKQLQFLSRF